MKAVHVRLRWLSCRWPLLALVVQVALIGGLCAVGQGVVTVLGLPIPGSVCALGLLLVLLATGAVPAGSLRRGANWLLAEMLLFFIPAVMAVSQHLALLRAEGVRILLVILLGTVAVMSSTALLVDLVWRWRRRHAQ